MERKLIGRARIIVAAVFFLSGFLCRGGFCLAAGSGPPGNAGQIEATVIHVDQYAVYVPNVVFYFDTKMEHRKIDALRRAAEQLRNKKAMISYTSDMTADPGSESRRFVLSDIVCAQDQSIQERPAIEAANQPDDSQDKQTRPATDWQASDEEHSPTKNVSSEPKPPPKQAALEEERQGRKTAAQPEPITREEVSEFVRRLLYLNGKKDLAALAQLYADKVDYYDRGLISRDKVLRDLGYYYRNWTQVDTQLEGDVLMTGFEPDVRIVKFISTFSYRNDRKSMAGKVENVWTVQRIDGRLKLIDVKNRILQRSPSGF